MNSFQIIVSFTLLLLTVPILLFHKKHMNVWVWRYAGQRLFGRRTKSEQKHVLFCFVDHYEPQWGRDVPIEQERARVDRWVESFPRLASDFVDSDGVHPQHTFFYPEEEYREEHLTKIEGLCRAGFGEIEIHLHHDNDTSENLERTLIDFAGILHEKHGALSRHPSSDKLSFGFIHGNWTLDNSGKNGRMCGVNDELMVLARAGCYADFTFPSAPHATQPAMINSIYYAKDDPSQPKSHNTGRLMRVLQRSWGDLLLITGPLALNWKRRKWLIFPAIENGDVRRGMEPTPDRIDLWVDANIHVPGRSDWVFVKIYAHGTQETDHDALLGDSAAKMYSHLQSKYNDGTNYKLHYVTAREMYNIAKAAEAGHQGNPNDFRDFELPRPACSRRDYEEGTNNE